jgi:tRNA-dihydrouridine synthase
LGLNITEQANKVYLSVIEAVNEAKLDYIVVHGRHAKQKSSEKPNWMCIKECKDNSKIPVLGDNENKINLFLMYNTWF